MGGGQVGRWGPLEDAASRGSLPHVVWSHRNRGNTPVPGRRPQEGAQGRAGGGLPVGLGAGLKHLAGFGVVF